MTYKSCFVVKASVDQDQILFGIHYWTVNLLSFVSVFCHCLVRFRELKYLRNRVKTQPLTLLKARLKG